jgi:hypothetical protein
MAKSGLKKWFSQKWVDIGSKKKDGSFAKCGRSKQKADAKRKYPKCVPAAKAASMSKGQIRSAVARKRAAGNPGGKPTNVKTIIKKRTGGSITQGTCWDGYKQVGMKKKGKKMVPNCVKASKGKYIGSHIKSDLAGKPVSNKSYEDYYKGMI